MLTLGRALTEEEIHTFEAEGKSPDDGQVIVINRLDAKKREHYLYEVQGTTVADNWIAYGQILCKQDCLSHLIRHLTYDATFEEGGGTYRTQVLQDAIHLVTRQVTDYRSHARSSVALTTWLALEHPFDTTRLRSLRDDACVSPFSDGKSADEQRHRERRTKVGHPSQDQRRQSLGGRGESHRDAFLLHSVGDQARLRCTCGVEATEVVLLGCPTITRRSWSRERDTGLDLRGTVLRQLGPFTRAPGSDQPTRIVVESRSVHAVQWSRSRPES